MLKKTSAYTGLVIVTAAGALLASSPAYALDSMVRGSHVRYHHRSHHRNHNWNGNAHHGRIFIRIYIYNKNNNHAVAVARPEQRRHRVVRDTVPIGGVTGGVGTLGVAPLGAPQTASEEAAPASSNVAPMSSTPDQGSTGTAGAPSGTGSAGSAAAPPALDEGTTGNVSP